MHRPMDGLVRFALVLACLSCTGCGRRVQTAADGRGRATSEQGYGRWKTLKDPSAWQTLQEFTQLLRAVSPASAFRHSNPGTPTLVGESRPMILHSTSRVLSPVRLKDADDDETGKPKFELTQKDMDVLRTRIAKIQKYGVATPAQKLVEIATAKPPGLMMRDFFATTTPSVAEAMQETVISLFGALPPFEFEATTVTTTDKLAALMLNLQMHGYMLRNAEYVMTLRTLLQLKTQSTMEFRNAFDRLDVDRSGFIETTEVEKMLRTVYNNDVPAFEVRAFVRLFDTDGDGRISWEEFKSCLGAVEPPAPLLAVYSESDDEDVPQVEPKVSGNVTVQLEGGEVEMDAAAYMKQLKAEALSLRAELQKLNREQELKLQSVQAQSALSSSITSFINTMPPAQREALNSGISAEVVDAMNALVKHILQLDGKERQQDEEVVMELVKLQNLCVYQQVLGYRLREAEAKGEAQDAIGQ